MPKILIVKTSSLGDVVHMLPAIHDAVENIDSLEVDWIVEEGFQEVPRWSRPVNQVFPVAIRRWRKSLFSSQTRKEIKQFKQTLQKTEYDYVVDSQGLLKSAVLTRWAKSKNGIWGYDKQSIREPLASVFYQHKMTVSRQLHAITRNRQLLAKSLDYSLDGLALDYGVADYIFTPPPFSLPKRYIMALHGTSKVDKEWPVEAWQQLIETMAKDDTTVLFPWGNQREKNRVKKLAEHSHAIALPKCGLSELAYITSKAKAVIGMDTGLMHIAAALNKHGIGLYPVTRPVLTGILTSGEVNLIENISGDDTKQLGLISQKMLTIMAAH